MADEGLIVVLPDGGRVVFVGDVDAQADGDGDLVVYAAEGRGARVGGFRDGHYSYWYLAAHAEVISPDDEIVIHDPKGLLSDLKSELTPEEVNALYPEKVEGDR
jgi:hypothetical protein